MRNGADRLRHAIAFELIGLLLCVPLASAVMGHSLIHTGVLTLALSLLATGWNVLYNQLTDHLMLRCLGRLEKRWGERICHAIGFEGGLLLLTLPLVAWWLDIKLWQALLLDLGLALFYVIYAFAFNLAYDRLFPITAR